MKITEKLIVELGDALAGLCISANGGSDVGDTLSEEQINLVNTYVNVKIRTLLDEWEKEMDDEWEIVK